MRSYIHEQLYRSQCFFGIAVMLCLFVWGYQSAFSLCEPSLEILLAMSILRIVHSLAVVAEKI